MTRSIKFSLIILSVIFSSVYFVQSLTKVDPSNKSLEENYRLSKMNLYPPSTYRLANIIENRPEFDFYFRLEKNFTGIFNFSKLYSNYLDLAILTVSLALIFKSFLTRPISTLLVCLPPLIALSFFPSNKTSTLFLFLPTIFLSLVNKNVK